MTKRAGPLDMTLPSAKAPRVQKDDLLRLPELRKKLSQNRGGYAAVHGIVTKHLEEKDEKKPLPELLLQLATRVLEEPEGTIDAFRECMECLHLYDGDSLRGDDTAMRVVEELLKRIENMDSGSPRRSGAVLVAACLVDTYPNGDVDLHWCDVDRLRKYLRQELDKPAPRGAQILAGAFVQICMYNMRTKSNAN